MKRPLTYLFACSASVWAQQPVINPGGVVSSASYAAGIGPLTTAGYPQTGGGPALAPGSLASIFGTNLASGTLTAQTPLPRQLGGTSVSVNGIAVPLLFVSPSQINFQVPSPDDVTPGVSGAPGVVVATAAGQSAPYQVATGGTISAPGIFTLDSSGCGRGVVLNVAADGSLSLNSPDNSASPGSFIAIYGTGDGVVYNAPPDGVATPVTPLTNTEIAGSPLFDFAEGGNVPAFWVGRAPDLVGVDQFNYVVPATARQGCAVPLQIENGNISAPVTVSIASGGGQCSDPPAQSYGEVTWEDETILATDSAPTTTETVTVSLQSSPGREAPMPVTYADGVTLPGAYNHFGPSCPIPGYRSLDAGAINAHGPGLAPVSAASAPISAETVINIQQQGGFTPVSQVQSGQAAGLTIYKAILPAGTIKPGSFSISATGGDDVGAFQSTVQIGSPIQVVTALAGRVLQSTAPFQVQWTGGDPTEWVILKLVGHAGPFDWYPWAWVVRASDEQVTIQPSSSPIGFGIGGPVEIVMEVVPDPSQVLAMAAPGLSLGGQAQWRYTYRFEGVLVE